MLMRPAEQFKLSHSPRDAVSCVTFPRSSNSQHVAVTAWDCTLRLFDIGVNCQRSVFDTTHPLLDCSFVDDTHIACGGLDRQLHYYDTTTCQDRVLGRHDDAISKVLCVEANNHIITGSWDQTIRLWDPRTAMATAASQTGVCSGSVYTLDACNQKVIVGMSDRIIAIYDLRNFHTPLQYRESGIKYQTRCIRCFPNGDGFVIASIEGRIAVEFFDLNLEVHKKKYAFKCHREKIDNVENVYPVNAIAFHRYYNTFATGGSDGVVNVWDAYNQKRLEQFKRFPDTITSLAFSHDGIALAIAVSDMNEKDALNAEVDPKPGAVYIRYVSEVEVRGKDNRTQASA